MNKNFAQLLGAEFDWTYTENGQLARSSTGSPLLDLYGTVGALRTCPGDVIGAFASAFDEDALLATKISFYARNIRGGLGERQVCRFMWRWLALNKPEIMKKNMHLVPLFGRWDDLYMLIDSPIEEYMWDFVVEQLKADMKSKNPSLLAKWLKSVNSSSAETRALGRYTAKMLGYTERSYRKTLSALRARLNDAVVETKMSAKEWDKIDFEKVCSKAMANNRKAFAMHDEERFAAYLEAVKKGEAKINSGTLYPYDIMEKMGLTGDYSDKFSLTDWDEVLEEQWKALPNYVEEGDNVLIVADTSGSMQGRPVCTSIGLAVYFAERNTGQFHNKFITFSSVPKFVTLKGKTLKEKIGCVYDICENTDLNAVFELILDVAVKNNVPQAEMPKKIVVISDMEIDNAETNYDYSGSDYSRRQPKRDFTTLLKEKYGAAGYELPDMVYWCVDSRHGGTFHADKDERGIQMASGQSASIFKAILKNIGFTAYDAMLEVLNDPVYNCVVI